MKDIIKYGLGVSFLILSMFILIWLSAYFWGWMTYKDVRCVTTSNDMYNILERYYMDVTEVEGQDVEHYQMLHRDLKICVQNKNTEIYQTKLFQYYSNTNIPTLS